MSLNLDGLYYWHTPSTSMTTPEAWVIGRGLYALSLVRALKQDDPTRSWGLITTDRHDLAGWTATINQVRYLDPPPQNQQYADQVEEILRTPEGTLAPSVVVGEEVFYLPETISDYRADRDLLARLHHKMTLFSILPPSYPHLPETHLYRNARCSEIFAERPGNAILKPVYSRGMIRTLFYRNGKFMDRHGNLLPDQWLAGEWVWQEDLGVATEENHFSSFTYAREGRILSHLVYQNRAHYAGFGVHRVLQKVPVIDNLIEHLVTQLKYTGFIGFDFIRRGEGYYPIECNPRMTNGISFFESFSLTEPSHPSRTEVISLVPYLRQTGSWKGFLKPNDLFRWVDPWPGIYTLWRSGKLILRSLWEGRPITETLEREVVSQIVVYEPK